jgi:uncharacterized membrane protein YfcA
LSLDFAPFADIPVWAVVCVFAAHFLGFFIRGAFGFGSNMPIVLLTTWLLGPHHAILLVVFTATAAQVHLFPQGFGTADWKVTRPLILGMFAGVAIGTWLFTILAADWLTLVMGILITVVVVMDRLRLLERLTRYIDIRARAVTSSLAIISGAVGTVSGGGGLYFLVVYLKLACKTAASLRGTNLILSGISILVRVALLVPTGFITLPLLIEAALLTPIVLLGTWTGTRVFHKMEARRFYDALQLLLLFAAMALMARGVIKVI